MNTFQEALPDGNTSIRDISTGLEVGRIYREPPHEFKPHGMDEFFCQICGEPRVKHSTLPTVALYSPASEKLDALCAITRPNHAAYSLSCGYGIGYFPKHAADSPEVFDDILHLLRSNDYVLSFGADVLFTNFSKRVEDLEGDHVTMALESRNWWPINNDVMRWKSAPGTICLLETIRDDAHIWKHYPWLWQNHIWNLICSETWVKNLFTLVPARTMNSTPHPGLGQWQLGDWICHMVDMEIPQKIEVAGKILKIAGKCDGSFTP